MTRRLRIAAVAVAALALTACSDDSPRAVDSGTDATSTPTASGSATESAGASGSASATEDPQTPKLSCPTLIPFPEHGENPPAPQARAAVGVPAAALHCTYPMAEESDAAGWAHGGKGKVLGSAERAAIFSQLSWKPAAKDRMCPADLGPLQVLIWSEADGTTQTLMMEDYGCRDTRVTTDVNTPVTTAPLEIPEAVITLLSDRS